MYWSLMSGLTSPLDFWLLPTVGETSMHDTNHVVMQQTEGCPIVYVVICTPNFGATSLLFTIAL